MKKAISNGIFVGIFMLMLIVPMIFINTKPQQVSEIDNKTLTEWQGLDVMLKERENFEAYLNDRIGFREQAIEAYIELNDKLFHVMVHPLFMYGKEGHIYFKDKDYIAAYQRLNTNEEYLDSFVDFLSKTNTYLKDKNIEFLYFLCPDKKSIYPEYFPDYIHVKEDETCVIDYMSSRLSETDMEYIIPKEELLKAKEDKVIYNKLYDATHWNEFGAFVGHHMIDDHIQSWFDDVRPLTEDDYDLDFVTMNTLDVAKFPIKEDVPVYTLKVDYSQDASGYLMPNLICDTNTFYSHYINPDCENDRKLLIFTDSYFANYQWMYNNRFKEVYFVHRQNYEYLQYFVNLLFPDAVIFETAERSITSEMPLLAIFEDYYYEKPYDGNTDALIDVRGSSDFSYAITDASGIRVDGNTWYLNPETGDNVININGYFYPPEDGNKYNVYLKIDDTKLEIENCALHRRGAGDNYQAFLISVQRRYIGEGTFSLIAENEETKETYLVEEFEVIYGE